MPDNELPGLVRYNDACRALAEARSVDEVKHIRDVAEAMRAYARQAKNKQLEIDAAEIRIRAERRLGEMILKQKETVGLSRGGRPKTAPRPGGVSTERLPTLEEVGISHNLSSRSQKLAAVPKEEFEGLLSDWRDEERAVVDILSQSGHVRGTFGSGENEWYTPVQYVDAARGVMGQIDLDPASSAKAQEAVRAGRFYDERIDGLAQRWTGRVWMNPPYAPPQIGKFIRKLVSEFKDGDVSEAIALTHNYTDTEWFHHAAEASSAICFTRGRVRFLTPDGEQARPTQGQAFFYFGDSRDKFFLVFQTFGFVVVV